MVEWLRPQTPTAVGMGSIPGQGAKMSHAVRGGQKEKINPITF